jgi:hypothetical protein
MGAAVFLTVGGNVAVAGVDLLPHRAVYAMSLGDRDGGGDIVRAAGQMVYRFAETCDGWTVENKTLLSLSYEDGRDVKTRWSFASFETLDGGRYQFSSRYDQDGETLEELRGVAEQPEHDGQPKEAVFAEPNDHLVPLPDGTVFPTDHIKEMIQAANEGQQTVSRVVFDGASLKNPYFVNAVITRKPAEGLEKLAASTGLPELPSWKIRMAFFLYDADAELPEFEIEALYRADGVADEIVQHFDDFSLRVRLKSIEVLDRPDC